MIGAHVIQQLPHASRALAFATAIALLLGATALWLGGPGGGESTADAGNANAPIPANPPMSTAQDAEGVTVDFINLQALAGEGNPLWAIALTSLNATRERPIFSFSRRPAQVFASAARPEPTASPTLASGPPLSLVGAIAADSDSIAIFVDETTRSTIRLRSGESYAGWILRVVAGREATLQKGQQISVLALPSASSK